MSEIRVKFKSHSEMETVLNRELSQWKITEFLPERKIITITKKSNVCTWR